MITLPNFKIKEIIYVSKHSFIYRAWDVAEERNVVIKILREEFPTPEQISRFEHEFQITKTLYHQLPDLIIQPYNLIKFHNTYAIILEDFEGYSLAEGLKEVPLTIQDFLELAITISEIVGKIHENHVLIKDINPSNILWNPSKKNLKFIDFGISTTLSFEDLTSKNVNLMEGTLLYIAPEQTGRMNRTVDYRADYYALGITFYEMITGQVPFQSSDAAELVYCHIAKQPIPPHKIAHEIPEAISDIILKLLNKTPELRYQSIFGLVYDLKECLRQFLLLGHIHLPQIATKDFSTTFQISERLYGREREIALLLEQFDKVTKGSVELTFLEGPPGIGKSALVKEIQKNLIMNKGFFLSGKFDQFKRNIPYESITQALKKIINEILQKTEDLLYWKQRFQEAIGLNGNLLIEILPQLKLIIGQQPELMEVGITEAKNRFHYALQNFIQSLAGEDHPLVLFLDDLQWADLASLEFLTSLLTSPTIHHIFLIGAYRDTEVDQSHQLVLMMDHLKKQEANFKILSIKPLQLNQIEKYLEDTLHSQETSSLAKICLEKTQGNPFFLNQLLISLYQERLVFFDLVQGHWIWDLEGIKKKDITDNVVIFMSQKITTFPPKTVKSLQLASCLGNRFDLQILAKVYNKNILETAHDLKKALEEGLLVAESDHYRFLDPQSSQPVFLHFLHDRVQQAAQDLINKEQKELFHYQIGIILLNIATGEDLEERVFEITNHLNSGIALCNQKEKERLLELNLLAGEKAYASSSFNSAMTYFRHAYQLVTDKVWETSYPLAFKLVKRYGEALYLLGNHQEAELLMQEALNRAHTALEKAEIHVLQEMMYTIAGLKEKAAQTSVEGLKLLGINLKLDSTLFDFLKEYSLTLWRLKGKKVEDLKNLPKVDDPKLNLILRILQECETAAYYLGKKYFHGILILKQINTILKYGNTPAAPRVYNAYALMQFMSGNFKQAKEFGDLTLAMFDEFSDIQSKVRTLGIYSIMVHPWSHHWNTLKEYFRKSIEGGLEVGDFMTAAIGATYIDILDPQMPLNKVVEDKFRYLNIVKLSKIQDLWDSAKIQYQLRACLSGQAESPLSFNDAEFNEDDCLHRMEQSKFYPGIAVYYMSKIMLNFHFGNYKEAYEYAKISEAYEQAVKGTAFYTFYIFYRFVAKSLTYPSLTAKEQGKVWKELKKDYRTVEKWFHHFPVNSEHLYYMMGGELAKIQGNHMQAMEYYDRAIQAAKKNEYIQFEAIANELGVIFYLQEGLEKIATDYFQEARYAYLKWGALGIIRSLKTRYPQWMHKKKSSLLSDAISTTKSTSQKTSSRILDFISIMKASQTLTREMLLSSLIEKMMRIVMENAGAEKACLFLEKRGQYHLEAEIDSNHMKVLHKGPHTFYPTSVIKYVAQTKEMLVINNATLEEEFKNDPYIKQHQVKSIVCSPLSNQGILKGILYLENNFSEGLFDKAHLEVISILCSQMAISIDNACFYEQLEEKIQERTTALHKAQQKLLQKEKMAFLGLLSNGIAHEIKNPLNFIINFSELSNFAVEDLKQALIGDEWGNSHQINNFIDRLKQQTAKISEFGLKANTIVNRMIEHSSSQNRELVLTDINSLIEQALYIFESNYPKKYPHLKIKVFRDYHAAHPYLKVSPADIKQVLLNLLDNCADALYEKKLQNPDFEPIINIATENNFQYYLLKIKDNGIGIKKEHLNFIFEPFFTTKLTGEGIGLGLSLCQNIIESKHSGKLEFETKEGEFTIFIASLPLSQQD